MLDPLAASTLGEAGNASLHFGQGDRAKIKAIFVRLGEPGDNLGIGVLAGRLAKNVGVEDLPLVGGDPGRSLSSANPTRNPPTIRGASFSAPIPRQKRRRRPDGRSG